MSNLATVPYETTLLVRDSCLCLHVQRAARALARRFDEALRPVNLTNGQFSLMMSLNRPKPAGMAAIASLLGSRPDHVDRSAQAVRAPRPDKGYGRPGGPAQPPADANEKGPWSAGSRRSDLEGDTPKSGNASSRAETPIACGMICVRLPSDAHSLR